MSHEPLPPAPLVSDIATTLSSNDVLVAHAWGSSLAWLLAALRDQVFRPIFVVTAEPEDMNDLIGDLELFGAKESVYAFPPWDVLPTETEHPEPEVAHGRITALRVLNQPAANLPPLLVAPAPALLQPTLPPDALARGQLSAAPGQEMSPEGLSARLLDAGLESTSQVDAPGQFSRRGGIVDVYPLFADQPIRIEFFGDEIDTIRHFDPATQRSEQAFDSEIVLIDVTRHSFREAYTQNENRPSGILDYLHPDTLIVLVNPEKLRQTAELYAEGFPGDDCPLLSWKTIFAGIVAETEMDCATVSIANPSPRLRDFRRLSVPAFGSEGDTSVADSSATKATSVEQEPVTFTMPTQSLERIAGGPEAALREIEVLLERGTRVTVFCQNPAERSRLGEILLEKAGGIAKKIDLYVGHIAKGFLATDCLSTVAGKSYTHWAVLGDHEIFARHQLRRQPRRKFAGAPIADFTDLREGDYVVHVINGVARYEGVVTLEANDTEQDYLQLRFAEDARLYVPLSHVDLVQRYIGSRDARPELSKLGGTSWARRKRAAEKAAKDIAADLLRVQAVREALPGVAFPPDDEMQMEFDNAFPYEETPDQLAAINDVKADQEKSSPMDRLICGDVGFGKTEVAIRAAFKTVNAGKQVAILVPTTILAEQHYRTFKERMADYPVRVGCLSRFRTTAEQRALVEDVIAGKVDIVIGTHRLLSQDVKFKELGLAVIDEEQRFGVEHKERLKALRASVDVITMTATPIPRTLHMSLLGLRDISTLTTAPTDRHSIRTMVLRYSDDIIRRAILRELARGGQCFFLHNRVQSIDEIAGKLAALVPEARFGIAHGQLADEALLHVMNRFLNGDIDVLVTTTIIESGVDIPTVNTLIVNQANHFGLSELHQLRGRVGRYRYQAYAYFLIPKKRPITPIAERRLQALEEYSELGAGFRIAMRDLEIRGAGNILGAEQSGQIQNVGFDLYCKLLEKAVAGYRGEDVTEVEPVELDLGTRAFIPTEYIADDKQRVDFYRKLSAVSGMDEVENLRGYLRDRYGALPEETERLFADQEIRQQALTVGVNFIGRLEGALVFGFAEGHGKGALLKLRSLGRKVTVLEKSRWRIELDNDDPSLPEILTGVSSILKHLTLPAPTKVKRPPMPRAAASVPDLASPAIVKVKVKVKPAPTRIDRVEVGSKPDRTKRQSVPGSLNLEQAKSLRDAAEKPQRLDHIEVGKKSRRTAREAMLDAVSSSLDFGSDAAQEADAEAVETEGARVVGLEPQARLGILGAVVAEGDFDIRRFGSVTLIVGAGADATRYFLRFTGTGRAPRGQISLTLAAATEEEVTTIVNDHLARGESRVLAGIVE